MEKAAVVGRYALYDHVTCGLVVNLGAYEKRNDPGIQRVLKHVEAD
jgi:hypothetical protein